MANRGTVRRMAFAVALAASTTVLGPSSASVASSPDAAARHVVVFDETRVPVGFAATAAGVGGTLAKTIEDIGVVTVDGLTDTAAQQLASTAGVLAVERDLTVLTEAEDTAEAVSPATTEAGISVGALASPTAAEFYRRQWNLPAIGAPDVWADGLLGSPDVSAFVLDTGIDYLHPDLVGRVDLERSISLVSSYSGEDDLVKALPGTRHPVTDLHSHGTAVAGLIVSNGIHLAGVTQRTTLVGVKVHDLNRSAPVSNYLDGIVHAANHGADVIHLSIPVEFDKAANPGLVAAVNRAINLAHDSGAVLVAAAGNAMSDLDHDRDRFRFCNAVHVICASATGPMSAAGVNGPWSDVDAIAAYTNFGRSAIDVAGPGGVGAPLAPTTVWLVCSQVSQTTTAPQRPCRAGAPDPRRLIWSSTGTSFGAAATSGLAALLVSVIGKDKPDEVQSAIKSSAVDLGQPGIDPYYGRGRIDIPRAVEAAQP